MILDELIESYPSDKEFMIGAHTGYFFGGNKTEYETAIDAMYRNHKAKTEAEYRHAMSVKEDARNYIKHYNNGKTVTISYVFDRDRVGEEAYANECREKLREIEALRKFYMRVKDYINMSDMIDRCKNELALPTYRRREVIEVNDSLVNPEVAKILIPGIHSGRFWDMDEVKKFKEAQACRKQDA